MIDANIIQPYAYESDLSGEHMDDSDEMASASSPEFESMIFTLCFSLHSLYFNIPLLL